MKFGVVAMKAGVNFGSGKGELGSSDSVKEIEQLGYDSVWAAEVGGTDALTPLAWIAAQTTSLKVGSGVMQMTARTPTAAAQAAATLDKLSNGRAILGLGPSGPGMVEGWHGVPYGKPLERTREYVDIVRRTLARVPVEVEGAHYNIPYNGDDASGFGNSNRLMFRPQRRRMPIYLAAMAPKALTQAYEIADGIIPLYYSPSSEESFFHNVDVGKREAKVNLAPFVPYSFGEDIDVCREKVKIYLTFFLGGMGPKGHNFYNRYMARLGYPEEAKKIQELYLGGNKNAAAEMVPDKFIDEISLCGPIPRVAEQLEAWHESKVGTVILNGTNMVALRAFAELIT